PIFYAIPFAPSRTNPVPSVSSLAPSNVLAGAAGFSLTVSGTNFVSTSVVRWNGTNRATTFVSSTQLRATILVTDVVTAGTAQVTVVNPAPGGGTSNPLTFTIASGFSVAVVRAGSGAGTVTITAPTSGATYTTGNPAMTLGGTASDNVGVTQVTWTNSRGGNGTATGTTSWTASGIGLQMGTNMLTVQARDAAGNTKVATLTVTLSGTSFTDDPLTAQSTLIKTVHLAEVRAAIDTVRVARGLTTFAWTDPTLTPGVTTIKVVHVTELRTALNQAYQAAARTLPTYTDPSVVAGATVVNAV